MEFIVPLSPEDLEAPRGDRWALKAVWDVDAAGEASVDAEIDGM
jgi:hypothetical protein